MESFKEKTSGQWKDIFKFFLGTTLNNALDNAGKHVKSPFNPESSKDGFRFDKDFEIKNGLGYCNLRATMSGVQMIAYLTSQDEKTVAHQIHKYLDGKSIDKVEIKNEIKINYEARKKKDIEKIESNKEAVKYILNKPQNPQLVKDYLVSRGLKNAIPNVSNDILGIENLKYEKGSDLTLPAIVSIVRNHDNKIMFLHKTFLDKKDTS